jgi:hypothetical protein
MKESNSQKRANKFFETVTKFNYLETTATDYNYIAAKV